MKTTLAMLDQKKRSLLHRIKLTYLINGKTLQPATEETLEQVKADLDDAKKELEDALSEDRKYAGGLIKAMTGLRVETARHTITVLRQQYIFAKYGLSLPSIGENQAPTKERPVVPDKDAL